jgi:RND family efflux transporter MFP subunit
MNESQSESQQGHETNKKSGLFISMMIFAVLLVIFGVVSLFSRHTQYQTLAKETETLAVPTVAVLHPTTEEASEDLVLPGTMQAYVETPIYARTNGYLRKWYFDIGSKVAKGQLLAEIDTPEVDQQLAQSKADLNTSKANTALALTTASRYTDLLKSDSVSKQEVDNTSGDLAAKAATQNSAEANVRRLEDLESFKRIYAPFSGVITRRNVDFGNLINAGNGGVAQQLFVLAQIDPLRVYVNVPEAAAASIHPGLGAYLVLAQFPGRRFEGRVVRTANAIDLASRTLLTEVDVPNKNGELLPGGYAEVHLEVKIAGARLQVPVNALLFRAEGLRAVTIDENHKTHLTPLSIGRDYGTTLEVLQGLKPDDYIVVNPADSLDEGVTVNVKVLPQQTLVVPAGQAPQPAASAAPGGAPATGQANGNGDAGNKKSDKKKNDDKKKGDSK